MEMEDGEQKEREELEEDALSPSPLAGLPPLEREEQFKKWYDLPEPDTLETPLWELKMELDLEEESSSHSPDPTEPPSPEEELAEEEES